MKLTKEQYTKVQQAERGEKLKFWHDLEDEMPDVDGCGARACAQHGEKAQD